MSIDPEPPPSDKPFAEIDGYRILERIDEGGMAVVYRAQQESPSREVAIKVIKPDILLDSARVRFEQEVQVLGRFQHPGIAQIYDAGTVGNEPYFVMELIEGVPLTDYVQSNDLSIEERVTLVRNICDAVHHAHQRGVIHRDLKPNNILVDRTGQPKVLDFGVARMTDSDVQVTTMQTEVGQLIGTLAYMSPEQAEASRDLDIRTDVYSLGVILYQILTGAFPYNVQRGMIHEIIHAIRLEDPLPLSSHLRVLRGDLETIAIKALAKDREQRYLSASEFGADLERFLNDEAILARPPSATYQLKKFARRHKAIVGGATAACFALIIGASVAIHYAVEAQAATREAQSQTKIATAIADFLNVDLIGSLDVRRSRGQPVSLRQAVDRAAERAAERFADQPDVEAGIRQTLGDVYASLGEVEKASGQYRRALELAPASLSPADTPHAPPLLQRRLGRVLLSLGETEEAEAMLRASVAELDGKPGLEEELGTSLEALGRLLRLDSRHDDARELLARAQAIFTDVHTDTHPSVLRVREVISDLERLAGNVDLSYRMLSEVHDARVRTMGADHPEALWSLQERAAVEVELFDFEAAKKSLDELEPLAIRVHDETHPLVAKSLYLRGRMHKEMGEWEAAEAAITKAVALLEAAPGSFVPDRIDALIKLGELRRTHGRLEESKRYYEEALELSLAENGEEHLSTVTVQTALGMALHRTGEGAAGREMLEEAEAMCRRIAPTGRHLRQILNSLAFVYRDGGDTERAVTLQREVLELTLAARGKEHPDTAIVLENLGNMLSSQGGYDEALDILIEVLRIRRTLFGERHQAVARTLFNLARTYDALGEAQLALEHDLAAVEQMVEFFGADHTETHRFCRSAIESLNRAVYRNSDQTYEVDPARIDELFAAGLEHPFLEELAVRLAE